MKKEETFEKIYKPWCKKNNRLPYKESLDPTEKRLGKWRDRNREWEVLREFNSQFDSKRKSKEKVFEEDYVPWVLEHQRLPIRESSDPIEKKLGYWRNNRKKWKELKEFNAQFNPKECKSKEKVFIENYKPWCLEHQKLPSRESPDPNEKKLGFWRNKNRKWEVLREFNSQFEPGCKSKEKVFTEEYISWVIEHQKLPNQCSPNLIEKKLGIWRSSNRKWNKLTQFNILFSYSKEGNLKAKELLEKMMH